MKSCFFHAFILTLDILPIHPHWSGMYTSKRVGRGEWLLGKQQAAQVLLGDVNTKTWLDPWGDTTVYLKNYNIVNWESQPHLTWNTLDEGSNDSGWGLGTNLLGEIKHSPNFWVSQSGRPRWDSSGLMGTFKRNVTIYHASKMGCGDYIFIKQRDKII